MSSERLTDNFHVLKDGKALVQFERLDKTYTHVNENKIANFSQDNVSGTICTWGAKNDLPECRENLLRENNIVPELIKTKRDIILGQGMYAYKERVEDGERIVEEIEMPAEAKELIRQMEELEYFTNAAKNIMMHANIFAKFLMKKGKVISISSKDARYIRAKKQNSRGKVPGYIWFSDWGKNSRMNDELRAYSYQAYDRRMIAKAGATFLYHVYDDLFFDGYYAEPAWWGGREWVELANAIPMFHKANLKNGYTIRYHIKIPKGYFLEEGAHAATPKSGKTEDGKTPQQKAAEKKQEFIDKMNKFLAGVENQGRAVYSDYDIHKMTQKEFPGIKIEPIKTDLQDEALLKLFEKSNQANISAQGLHPTLAAIETQGKLSSGSEIRNAFNMYIALKSAGPRKLILKPLMLAAKINKWDSEMKFGFRDIEIQKLDDNPAGMQLVQNTNNN